jgi:hypothetical protein
VQNTAHHVRVILALALALTLTQALLKCNLPTLKSTREQNAWTMAASPDLLPLLVRMAGEAPLSDGRRIAPLRWQEKHPSRMAGESPLLDGTVFLPMAFHQRPLQNLAHQVVWVASPREDLLPSCAQQHCENNLLERRWEGTVHMWRPSGGRGCTVHMHPLRKRTKTSRLITKCL